MDTIKTENNENTLPDATVQQQEVEQMEKAPNTEEKSSPQPQAKGKVKKDGAKKKKSSGFGNLLKVIGCILLLVIIALAAWILYSGLNKKKSLSLLPSSYGLYLHTDSVWEALNPLLDLQAADILLATEEFSSFQVLSTLLSISLMNFLKKTRFMSVSDRPVQEEVRRHRMRVALQYHQTVIMQSTT